jgi:hypothetical protein
MKRISTWMAVGAAFCLSVAGPFTMKAANKNKELEEALKAKYELARISMSHVRITHPGTVLVIQKDGIYAGRSYDPGMPPTTKVVDGNLEQPHGIGYALMATKENQSLKAGETVYVLGISVRNKEVRFLVVTCNTSEVNVNGNTQETRHAANVAFEFPQGFLETADASSVEKTIGTVLLPEDEVQAAKTKTVELGQTPEQVKSALGAPNKVVKLGPKEIYVYKDMKVIFMDGKVSDVE